jgi:hypothetical protein
MQLLETADNADDGRAGDTSKARGLRDSWPSRKSPSCLEKPRSVKTQDQVIKEGRQLKRSRTDHLRGATPQILSSKRSKMDCGPGVSTRHQMPFAAMLVVSSEAEAGDGCMMASDSPAAACACSEVCVSTGAGTAVDSYCPCEMPTRSSCDWTKARFDPGAYAPSSARRSKTHMPRVSSPVLKVDGHEDQRARSGEDKDRCG